MRRVRVTMSAAAVFIVAACGGSGGVSADEFANRIDDVCRSLDRDLGALAAPATPEEVAGFASSASRAYEEAVVSLRKLKVPSGTAPAVVDAKKLVANLDAQIDVLDEIARVAGSDQAAVDSGVAKFEALAADNAGLADSIGAGRCELDPLFADLPPPTTTVPATTAPPVTDPPVTDPPPTTPAGSAKTVVSFAPELTPHGVFTFGAAPDDLIQTFITVLELNPQTSGRGGTVSGTEVFDTGDLPIGRVFAYVPDANLVQAAVDEFATLIAGDAQLLPISYSTLKGYTYTGTDGGVYFVGSNLNGDVSLLVWAVAVAQDTLETVVEAFLTGAQG